MRSDLRMALADSIDTLDMIAKLDGDRQQSLGQWIIEATRNGATFQTRSLLESSTAGTLLAQGQPIPVPPLQRRLFLRDLVTVVPTTTYSTPFVRELNPLTSELAASGVAEGQTKPDATSSINLTPIQVTPGVLAVNLTPTTQLWSDSPAAVAYLNGRLGYAVKVREEYACLRGNGETVNAGITGILNTTGIYTGTAASMTAAVTSGAAQLTLGGVLPDTAFVNAYDYFTAYQASPQWFDSDSLPLNLIPTTSLPRSTCVVGDFRNGAAMVDRQEANVQVYEQHADYAAKGQVLVQAEERIGFTITLPWAFAEMTGW